VQNEEYSIFRQRKKQQNLSKTAIFTHYEKCPVYSDKVERKRKKYYSKYRKQIRYENFRTV